MANVDVAYSVDATPEEGIAAWRQAYDYTFEDKTFEDPEIQGRNGRVLATVVASDQVRTFAARRPAVT